jgi:hypothetical protein
MRYLLEERLSRLQRESGCSGEEKNPFLSQKQTTVVQQTASHFTDTSTLWLL